MDQPLSPTIAELVARKSVRAFTAEPITPEQKLQILDAAAQAPTAGNQQLYTILDITKQDLKDRLAVLCDNQPFIAKAPLVLIFLADCAKWPAIYTEGGVTQQRTPGVGDLLLAASDANIAAQNAVVAAWSLGIGSCYIGDIMERAEELRELVDLPPYVFPAAMLVFGWPTEQQKTRQKPERMPLDTIVMQNAYTPHSSEDIRRMIEGRTSRLSFEDWVQAFCARKYESDFSREMTRSVSVYLADFEH